ncbi:MAG: hypothetical protein KBG22_10515 [Smithella sp.]|nr:hypothetical protein [Smithella sp.]MDM7985839.1 hypothetical protein [Smithella sp.]
MGGSKTMWLYLKTGFYSIVHKPPCKQDELLVRARAKEDIARLQDLLKNRYQFEGQVIDSPKADYAYRMIVPREIFALVMLNAVIKLKYDNFKNTVHVKDFQRHDAYMRCWEAMNKWQRDLQRAKGRK